MNCIIIEDEQRTADHLSYLLQKSGYEIEVLSMITSVADAVDWLKQHKTDLVFMDVQLDDGLGFEIFDHIRIKTPVIFTTSFDQYITKAFEVNGISYLLKPVTLNSLKQALEKYEFLYLSSESVNEKVAPINKEYQKRFMVQSGTTNVIVSAGEIAYFKLENKRHIIMTTLEGKQHVLDNTLKAIEQRLNPDQFFRINQQYIINIATIIKMYNYDRGRFKLEVKPPAKEEMIVSIERASDFKNWVNK
jgi:DNA-binding LytR/AlgR family response regulator